MENDLTLTQRIGAALADSLRDAGGEPLHWRALQTVPRSKEAAW